jgi:hypothetical protein
MIIDTLFVIVVSAPTDTKYSHTAVSPHLAAKCKAESPYYIIDKKKANNKE